MRPPSAILCAIDIDDIARTTFDQALAIARHGNAKLLLVCAVPPHETFKRRASERASYLMRLRREAEGAGVDVHIDVQTGDIAEIVVLHADTRRADLIVIGVEHGRGHGREWGAVAEDVLRSASCPTLVVPAGAPARSSFSRIVSAVDVDTGSRPSVEESLQLASRRHPQLTVLNVAKSRAAATDALPRIQSLIPPSARPATLGRVVVGGVSKEVLRAARAMGADLVVIGARRRSRIGRRLFGVTRQILTTSACPVLATPIEVAAVQRLEREAA